MHDDRVSAALKSLPREQAGLSFTAGVLRRIETPSRFWSASRLPTQWAMGRWATVTAACALVLVLGFSWREWRHRQAVANLRVLLAEKQELEAELEDLRRLTAEARPVVYLGGDDKVDLVLDLARFKRHGGFGSNLQMPAEGSSTIASTVRNRNTRHKEQTARPLRVVY